MLLWLIALACKGADFDRDGVSRADDCDDRDPAVSPGAEERCDGLDNDCDGAVDEDATDALTFYEDQDGDGFGDPDRPVAACALAPGLSAAGTDCDDGLAEISPALPEACDGLDNDCDALTDEGLAGDGPACPVESCKDLAGAPDGLYYIDPDEDGVGTAAFCDLSADGGGWTLAVWSAGDPDGVPYPGLSVCPGLDCFRGSAAPARILQALIQGSGEVAVGYTSASIGSFQPLSDHEDVGIYSYGDLRPILLAEGGDLTRCDVTGTVSGTFRALIGPSDYDGATVFMAPALRYNANDTQFNDYSEGASYIWSPGTPEQWCSGTGNAPGTWLGGWGVPEVGPLHGQAAGARSVWFR